MKAADATVTMAVASLVEVANARRLGGIRIPGYLLVGMVSVYCGS